MSTAPTLFASDARHRLATTDDSRAGHILAALTDEVANGLIVCDANGLLHYANRSARNELERGTALRLVDNAVGLARGSHTALRSALQDAAWRQRRRMLAVGSGAERLVAPTMPLQADLDAGDGNAISDCNGGALVVVMLGRRGTCSALGIEMLAMLHGLTLAERRVLHALLDGESPNRIALTQGIAVSTVRTHVKAVRDKMGVRSVEGLFIRAAEVPPITTALRCEQLAVPSATGCRSRPAESLAMPA